MNIYEYVRVSPATSFTREYNIIYEISTEKSHTKLECGNTITLYLICFVQS